jgi:hypothetical protein
MGKLFDSIKNVFKSSAETILGEQITKSISEHKDDLKAKNEKQLPITANSLSNSISKILGSECDPLIAKAILDLVDGSMDPTTSNFQRRYEIGYNRAGRLMQQIEDLGIVGPSIGLKKRELLVSSQKELSILINKQLEIVQRFEGKSPEEMRKTLRDTLGSLLSPNEIPASPTPGLRNTLEVFNNSILSELPQDDNGFYIYPNGIKIVKADDRFNKNSVLHDIINKLGYHFGEVYYHFHSDNGSIVVPEVAVSMTLYEIISQRLICIVRNDDKILNYNELISCKKAVEERGDDYDIWNAFYLREGAIYHNISRTFIERVFGIRTTVPISVNKEQLLGFFYSKGLDVGTIEETILTDSTCYDITFEDSERQDHYNMLLALKPYLELELYVAHIDIIELNSSVIRLAFPNYTTQIREYTFTFGGTDYLWLTQCLQNGISMLAKTTLLTSDYDYYQYHLSCNEYDKKLINLQSEYYSKIEDNIKHNSLIREKFITHYESDNWKHESYDLVNFIAIAAYYKQCDVPQDVFIESTQGRYEVLERNIRDGISYLSVKAYDEIFFFVAGHSMPEEAFYQQGLEEYHELNATYHNKQGYIYVMVNPSLEGMVKIGKTSRDPKERAKELSTATGVPTPFILVYQKQFEDCDLAERTIHQLLESRGCRVNNNREFFNISTSEAIDLIQSYAGINS